MKHNIEVLELSFELITISNHLDDNPETIKVFSKCKNLTLEFIKGCLLGTSKVLITKCLKQFNDEFPNVDSKI